MNYLESMRKRREAMKARYRKRCFVALFIGLVAGFLFGCGICRGTAKSPATATLEAAVGPVVQAAVNYPEPERLVFISPDPIPESVEPEPAKKNLLGTYRITAYCSCEICCGEWAKNRPNGIVYGAAGVELKPGVSCASTLPFGTVLEIDGIGERVVQDRTSQWVIDLYGENLIDLYFDDHQAALNFGVKYLEVYEKEVNP